MADASQDYVAPARAAQAVVNSLGNTTESTDTLEILDAGCGTGLVGVELARLLGASTGGAQSKKLVIDGIDLSPGMLAVARQTGVYRSLEPADLSKRLDNIADGTYDVVTCVGTLTQGHVGPGALKEFVRVAKGGGKGVVVATVRETVWDEQGYEGVVGELASEGRVEVLGRELEDYRRAADARAFMLRLRVLM